MLKLKVQSIPVKTYVGTLCKYNLRIDAKRVVGEKTSQLNSAQRVREKLLKEIYERLYRKSKEDI
jgi:hypothetical protein